MDRREFLVAGAAALATTGCVAESARIADAGVETPTANGEKAESSLIVSPPVLQGCGEGCVCVYLVDTGTPT